MTPALWILSGGGLGFILGALFTLIWAKEKLCAYYQDMEHHQYAALTMARKLAEVNIENDHLKEQIGGLHAELERDPSEAWKEQA